MILNESYYLQTYFLSLVQINLFASLLNTLHQLFFKTQAVCILLNVSSIFLEVYLYQAQLLMKLGK